jgi:hypothetical protein
MPGHHLTPATPTFPRPRKRVGSVYDDAQLPCNYQHPLALAKAWRVYTTTPSRHADTPSPLRTRGGVYDDARPPQLAGVALLASEEFVRPRPHWANVSFLVQRRVFQCFTVLGTASIPEAAQMTLLESAILLVASVKGFAGCSVQVSPAPDQGPGKSPAPDQNPASESGLALSSHSWPRCTVRSAQSQSRPAVHSLSLDPQCTVRSRLVPDGSGLRPDYLRSFIRP